MSTSGEWRGEESLPGAGDAPETLRGVDLVLYGQVSMAFFFAVCVALHPGFVLKRDEGGISNYGEHIKTGIPYTAAYVAAAASSWVVGARAHAERSLRDVARVLWCYGVLVTLTLVSTYFYKLSGLLDDLHVAVGGLLIAFEVVTSVWMVRRLGRRRDWWWLGVELTGSTLAVLTAAKVFEVLFVSQMIIGAGYAAILISFCHRRIVARD